MKQKHLNWISSNGVTLTARTVWFSLTYNTAGRSQWQMIDRDTDIPGITSTWQKVQKCHPYTGYLHSTASGDSKNAFLHCGGVLELPAPIRSCFLSAAREYPLLDLGFARKNLPKKPWYSTVPAAAAIATFAGRLPRVLCLL